MKKTLLMLCLIYYITSALFSSAEAATAREFASRENCRIDQSALDLLESLGELTYLDSAYILRINTLPADKQRTLTLKLAADGHITVEKLKRVPLAIAVPKDAGDIIPLLYEQLREDYWRGWLRRHSFMADVKMREWRNTAKRRFVKPDTAVELIDIFFKKREGKDNGPSVVYIQ